jgi:hypothetical protein
LLLVDVCVLIDAVDHAFDHVSVLGVQFKSKLKALKGGVLVPQLLLDLALENVRCRLTRAYFLELFEDLKSIPEALHGKEHSGLLILANANFLIQRLRAL